MDSDNCRKMYVIGTQEIKGDKKRAKEKKRAEDYSDIKKPQVFMLSLFVVSKDSNRVFRK